MLIKFSPRRQDTTVTLEKYGDVLVINGERFDFSFMGEGDTLPASAITSEWFVGEVDKHNGNIVLTLILPLPSNYSPEQAFPVDLVDVPDGIVELPKPLSNLDNEVFV